MFTTRMYASFRAKLFQEITTLIWDLDATFMCKPDGGRAILLVSSLLTEANQ